MIDKLTQEKNRILKEEMKEIDYDWIEEEFIFKFKNGFEIMISGRFDTSEQVLRRAISRYKQDIKKQEDGDNV